MEQRARRFHDGTPWIPAADDYRDINAEAALRDPDSIFYHYQKLIKLRKEYDIVTEGTFELLAEDDPAVLAYVRHGKDENCCASTTSTGKKRTLRFRLKTRTAGGLRCC